MSRILESCRRSARKLRAERSNRSPASGARKTLKKLSENPVIQFAALAMMPFGAYELGERYMLGDPKGQQQRDAMEKQITLVNETRQLIQMNKEVLVAIYGALKPAFSGATVAAHATPAAAASPTTNASTVAAPAPPLPATPAPTLPATPAPPLPATPAPPLPATPATPAGASGTLRASFEVSSLLVLIPSRALPAESI